MSTRKVQSNLRRCPLLKITKRECIYDDKGNLIKDETWIELNECYQGFCMAWDKSSSSCKIYPDYDVIESEAEEDDD